MIKFCSLHLEKIQDPSCGDCYIVKDEQNQRRAEIHEMYLRNKIPEERIGYCVSGLSFYSKTYGTVNNQPAPFKGYSTVQEALRVIEVFYNRL